MSSSTETVKDITAEMRNDAAEDAYKRRFGLPWTNEEDEFAAWLFDPEEGGDHA